MAAVSPSAFLVMQVQPEVALHDEIMEGAAQHQHHGHYQPPQPQQQLSPRSVVTAPSGPVGNAGPVGSASAQLGGSQQSFFLFPLQPPFSDKTDSASANHGSRASAPRVNVPATAPPPPAAAPTATGMGMGTGTGAAAAATAAPAFMGASGPFFSELLSGAPGGSVGLLPPLYPSSLDAYGVRMCATICMEAWVFGGQRSTTPRRFCLTSHITNPHNHNTDCR